MKQAKRSLYAIATLLILFLLQQLGYIGPLLTHISQVPWWVYLVMAGILFSGYQAYSLTKSDQVQDEHWNEQQGEVYIKRMKAEKEKRHQSKKSGVV